MPSTLTALDVSGSCTDRGTEPSAPRWNTISGATDRVVHAFVGAQLSLDHLHVEAVEVRAAAGREVVENDDVVAAFEQLAHEVRPDEPRAAGDEDLPTAAQPTAVGRVQGQAVATSWAQNAQRRAPIGI